MWDAPKSVGGRLVFEDRVAPGRLTIDKGRIVSVDLDASEENGVYVCPGFVDVHCHGWGGHDAMGDAPEDGAGPLGFNLEGPYISEAKKGAQNPAYIQVPVEADRTRLELLLDDLRIITIAPEVPGGLDMISWFTTGAIALSAGYSNATSEQADAAYKAGALTTTHLFNAMSGVHNHESGLAVAALADDGVYVELIADGFHVDRSVWALILRCKTPERLILVSDAIAIAGTGDGHWSLGGLEVEVRDNQCRLVSDGRLAGSVIALDTAVRNLVRSGVSLSRAVAAASRNPLALLGVRDRGRLAPRQRADLVLLDEGLAVQSVIRGGRSYGGLVTRAPSA